MKIKTKTYIFLIFTVLFCQPAKAEYFTSSGWWSNKYTYYDIKEYKGNVDIIKSPHSRTLVEAYRLMNYLDIPNQYYSDDRDSRYDDYGAEEKWNKKVGEILLKPDPVNLLYFCSASTALGFLEERSKKFGESSEYLKEWTEAQNKVFKNCDDYHRSKIIDRNNKVILPPEFSKNDNDSAELKQFKKDDHDYQMASAYFYAQKFEEALKHYKIITDNPQSIHYATAHYMIARTLLHAKDEVGAYKKIKSIIADPTLQSVAQDAAGLLAVLSNDSSNPDYQKEQLDEILSELSKKHNTNAEKEAFAKSFTKLNFDFWYMISLYGTNSEAIKQIINKSDILDWLLSFTAKGPFENEIIDCSRNLNDSSILEENQSNETAQCIDKNPILDHAIAKWKATKKMHWLVIAALKTSSNHKFSNEVIKIHQSLQNKVMSGTANDSELYAYPTITFYAADFLIRKKRYDEAEKIIYLALQQQKEFAPRIAINAISFWLTHDETAKARRMIEALLEQKDRFDVSQVYILKMVSAQSLDELLRSGNDLYYYEPKDKITNPFDTSYNVTTFFNQFRDEKNKSFIDSSNFPDPLPAVLNLLPIRTLIELSNGNLFGGNGRIELKLVAWIRAILLEKYDVADELALDLKNRIPELSSYFEDYLSYKDAVKKHRSALYLFLKNPRVKPYIKELSSAEYSSDDLTKKSKFEAIDVINHNDNNWWCSNSREALLKNTNTHLEKLIYQDWKSKGSTSLASKYKPLEAADYEELQKILKVGGAVRYLPTETVKWYQDISLISRYFGQDKLLPEALNMAVRVTRYGCYADGPRGIYSRSAFMALHNDKLFSKKWKDKTPYWFNKVP